MEIRMSFLQGKETMNFTVRGTEIFYKDRVWDKGIRCIPKDENFIRLIVTSRNKFPAQLKDMFNLSPQEQKEYDETAPKGSEALAAVIIRDCQSKGLILLNKQVINDEVKRD